MKISELTLAGTIAGTEVFPIVQGGQTKKVSIADALAGGGGGTSTGVNGLNGTTNIGLGGTLENNTTISGVGGGYSMLFEEINLFKVDLVNFELYQGGLIKLLSANDSKIILGYHDINTNAITVGLSVDLNGLIKTQLQGVDLGLKLDYQNNAYFFGGNPGVNGSTFVVDNFNGFILIKDPIGTTNVINFDMVGQVYEFGDLVGNNKITFSNNGEIRIDVTNLITTENAGTLKGLRLDFANDTYQFGCTDGGGSTGVAVFQNTRIVKIGDSLGAGNGNFIQVDDSQETIRLSTANGSYNVANIQAFTDNAAALAGGLSVGDLYRHDGTFESADQLRIVH